MKHLTPEQKKKARRRDRLRAKYRITPEQYEAWAILQDGRCAICRQLPPVTPQRTVLVVDHCHTTGKPRGLLCYRCNASLGMVGESLNVLRNMVRYLEVHGK
ncbi:MAG: endonuclease VII domain-containing protein [Phycisphaerales bacterium]|nr:endonuclease VII domain-containing protein [Phycisphaerales bacterium]